MPVQSPAYKNYLRNRQNEVDAEKLKELRKLNLFNEKTFYKAFMQDMLNAKKEIVIYCPFISKYRSDFFRRTFETLRKRNVCIFIFTRPIEEHDYLMRAEIKCALKEYEELGANIIYLSGLIHEKAAIIDQEILWEGSLNILSQRESKEIMRRTEDEEIAIQVLSYLNLKKPLADGYKNQYERLCRNLIENKRYDSKFRIKIGKVMAYTVRKLLFLSLQAMIISLKAFKSLVSIISSLYK